MAPFSQKLEPPQNPGRFNDALAHTAARTELHVLRDCRAPYRQLAQFGQREDAENDRHERNAILQIKDVAGPAHLPRCDVGPDHAHENAEACGDHTPQRGIARQCRDHRHAEDRQRKHFGRADRQHERPHQRQGDRENQRTDEAAEQGRRVARAQGACRFAALCHRQAVEHGRLRSGMAWHAEQHGRDHVGCRNDRRHAEQHRKGRIRVHRVGERHQQREAGQPADARQQSDRQPDHHPQHEEDQAIELQERRQRMACRHQRCFVEKFHA
ncbi:hypothetical protein FEP39_05729 [Burkholderia multivorans]|nr:hypothetical protein [Burkholderia multivorans]MDR9072468.1 hypothetical protein [Burkholderia multivorans]MDR9084142.1 hypothetical protein [Burkholderia multivorans]MDR9107928.1 hypothetical protein [Burkholderia multivorans]MDR9125796.1 hypothetical protein [Burkholderia multivorans]